MCLKYALNIARFSITNAMESLIYRCFRNITIDAALITAKTPVRQPNAIIVERWPAKMNFDE